MSNQDFIDLTDENVPADITNRIETLEDRRVYYEIFEIVSGGTTGTVTKPTGSTILLDRYQDAGDCLIVKVDTNNRPIDSIARDASGNPITSTFNTSGNYNFSGVPSAYPVALVYQISILAKDSNNVNQDIVVNETNIVEAEFVTFDDSISELGADDSQVAIDKTIELLKYHTIGVVAQPTITDNGNGSVTIGTDGIAIFNKLDNGTGRLIKLNCSTGTTITPTDGQSLYLLAQYNNGNPIYSTTTSSATFLVHFWNVPIAKLVREGNKVHVSEVDDFGIAGAEKSFYKDVILNGFQRQSGLTLSTSGTRISTVSAGTVWYGVQLWHTVDNISGTSGSLYEYYLTSGTWNKSVNLSAYDSTYYSDGTNRQTLGSSKWVAKYFFRDCGDDNEVYYIHGNQYTSSADALNEALPSMPSPMMAHSIYVGKIVIQQGSTNGTAYPRDWGTAVQNASVTNHENLSGLLGGSNADHQHLTTTELTTVQSIPTIRSVTKESTGFVSPENITLTYDSTARTVTLTGSVTAYWRGTQVTALTNGWTSTAHDVANASYFLYYDGSNFIWSTTAWTFDMLQIAFVNYGVNDKFAVREMHEFMAWQTHRELHQTLGTYKVSGGDLSNYTLSSTTATDKRPYVSATTLADEDLLTTNALHNSQLYTKSYLTGTGIGTTNFFVETAEIVPITAGVPYYNQNNAGTWQQTIMSTNNYQAVWLIGIPTSADVTSQKYRYVWMQGQSQSASLTTIQALTPANLSLGSFPTFTNEYVFLAKVIIRYTGSTNWVIISVESLSGNRYNQVSNTTSGYLSTVNVSSGISGDGTSASPITNDLITGKAGGQIVYGGTANSETIEIRSTAGATKGKIYLGRTATSKATITLNEGNGGIALGGEAPTANQVNIASGLVTKFSDTTDATSSTSSSVILDGGMYLAKKLIVNGGNIVFPSVQVSSADRYTLDDYIEDNATAVTATIEGGTSAGTASYSKNYLMYTKIGNIVIFTVYLTWTSHTGTGAFLIKGLPYATRNLSGEYVALSVSNRGTAPQVANSIIQAYMFQGSSTIVVDQSTVGTGTLTAFTAIPASGNLIISGQFRTS